jgi:hypothetical protein
MSTPDTTSQHRWASSRLIDINLWAASMGVFAGDHNTLDQRLSHHPEARDAFMLVLRTLDATLDKIIQTSSHSVDPRETDEQSILASQESAYTSIPNFTINDTISAESRSSSSGDLSAGEATSDSDGDYGPEQELRDVEEIIGQLIDLGGLVKRAGKSSRFRKADAGYKRENHAEFEAFLRLYLFRALHDAERTGPKDTRHQMLHQAVKYRRQAPHESSVPAEKLHTTTEELIETARKQRLSPEQVHMISMNLRRRNRINFALTRATTSEEDAAPEAFNYERDTSVPQPRLGISARAVETPQKHPSHTRTEQSRNDASTLDRQILQEATRYTQCRHHATTSAQMTTITARIRYPKPPPLIEGMATFCCPACGQRIPVWKAESEAQWR